jgi:MFS family permease
MLLILTDTVPKHKRPLMTGIAASCAGAAACLGPILGGIFTTKVSWRWCFYINLPLGAVTAVIMSILYTPIQRERKDTPWKEIFLMMDPLGCLLFTGSIVSLLLAFTFAATGSWKEARTVALLALFAALLFALVIEQLFVKPERALLPRSILKKRGIILCALFGFLTEVGSTAHVYYLPFYFQGSHGATAEASGVDVLPYLLSQTISGFITGVIINFSGYFNPSMLFGSTLFSIGCGLLYTLSATTPQSAWIGYQVLAGFGTGCCQFMAMGIAQQLLSRKEESIGLSTVYMIKTLGS